MTTQEIIENAFENRDLLSDNSVRDAIREVIDQIDRGVLRVAEPRDGQWIVNEWVKKAVLLYFPICEMQTLEAGPFEYHDKMPLKHNYAQLGVR
nr:2,3,4,5-tetrahydropyridine-2,6-dicarboxylate N-succinyltransferase [Bacteroidales bacterium]